ncbi:MMPL family transporter [Burkholderia multivorans]|uniref:hopanoid transporter HpnN n=1 Tax=Burkholderia multivorans TaxID=87883 RepID=UPI0020197C5D|nr:MMPL family transporter [Burkholderia multivorans]MCL4650045.1 MMPL family transporter [Burkholderia multivorans]MCL4656949.1 MMPL family transporter [Burkholderia multivorans]MCO1422879.1 MMPL family transporter [Burkholderia multivorans]UQN54616.1 MMPL family transporter [Burkholderia multivorans]UQN80458.1 MMPL family transporter [Burkholderia multivorans]
MVTSLIVRLVAWSVRRPVWVVVLSLLIAAFSGVYVARHFKINTDISKLVDAEPQWAALSQAVDRAFPQRNGTILAVVEAPAPEFATAAAHALTESLQKQAAAGRIGPVAEPGGGPFFEHNGLLFLSPQQVADTTSQLASARPLVNELAKNPSLTGLATTLSTTLGQPLLTGQVKLPSMAKLLSRSAATVDDVLAGKPAAFSWRALVDNDAARQPARAFVTVQPVVNYGALKAGAQTSDVIRETARALDLEKRYGAVVRLTGEQPLADDEFSSVEDGAALNGVVTLLVVFVILWLALRSKRMIASVLVTLFVGLVVTAALGLAMVGSLNMISVAFMVLFVGLGVDFSIQYGVKYREERFRDERIDHALIGAAHSMGMPLALATTAVAASFFSFIPTAYRGVSELGLIAGVGMFVALLTTLTLLPALLRLFAPPGESKTPGFPWLAPVDDYLDRHRKPILIGTLAVVIGALPLLAFLHFDFNPLHLKDPHSESMSTLLALKDSPEAAVNDVTLLAPSLADADAAAKRLDALPEVGRTTTLSTFIPADQPEKRAAIATAASTLLPALTQPPAPPATDAQRVAALKRASDLLGYAAEDHPGPGAAAAQHLSQSLAKLAAADSATRDRAERAFADTLRIALNQLAALLQPHEITRDTLPPTLVRDWVAPDGKALVQISPKVPKGVDPNDDTMLRHFATAVKAAEPGAIGGPISILHSADTIINAFLHAALWSIISITILLWITLRRFGDVLRTLVPLLVSGIVTLEMCVVLGMSLNFANIIALPLMLGVGVAFKVYFVMAWRAGQTGLLHSSLTHAVLFSAATTATAFGSLWLSHHPGTSSMGKLLALALTCTLIGAVVFQPVLMGKPRVKRAKNQAQGINE